MESFEIEKLVTLFNCGRVSDDEDEISSNVLIAKPGDIGLPQEKPPTGEPQLEKAAIQNCEDENYSPSNEDSWKKCPTWEVSYKQNVTASDMFLQMGGKTTATASCEDMIMKIHLPGEKRQNIDVKIERDRIVLHSPRFFLGCPLPHPVDPKMGNAQWDADAEKLIVTLRMDREFDYVNF